MILQSLVDNKPNSANIKELVDLLKKVGLLLFRQLNTIQSKETIDVKYT
jgi:hypothetical protein